MDNQPVENLKPAIYSPFKFLSFEKPNKRAKSKCLFFEHNCVDNQCF